MTEEAESGVSTRDRVLESAMDVFAEKGFEAATIHEICEGADANIAAVNYYFGSKESLYAEAWRTAFEQSVRQHPPDGGVPPGAPPEERLRGRIRALIHRVADEDNQAFVIAHREMTSPTPLLEEVRREYIGPLSQAMRELVRELLGPDGTEQQITFCEVSIVSQCISVILRRRHHEMHGDDVSPQLRIRDLDAYADHVARFALAGVRAMRRCLSEPGDTPNRKGAE